MTAVQNFISPKSAGGSFIWSLAAHLAIAGTVVVLMNLKMGAPAPAEEYIDLAYETFDAPPAPTQEEKPVMRQKAPAAPVETKTAPDTSAHELQDEKGDVAGTQEAKKETNVASEGSGTAATTPYYKIKPKYPKAALISGVEGWVLLQIDIAESGEVENVRVIDGEQKNMFESEAKRAVSQWKYRPFVDGSGKPFRKADYQVRVDFKLEEAETITN